MGHNYGIINNKVEDLVSSRPNLSGRRKIKAKPQSTFEDLLSPPSTYHVKHCRTHYSSKCSEAEKRLLSVSENNACASFGLVTNDSLTEITDQGGNCVSVILKSSRLSSKAKRLNTVLNK